MGTGLVFDVEGHRIAQQPNVLEGHLGHNQQHQQHGCKVLADGDQDGHHGQLEAINHSGADPAGPLDAKGHRQGLQAHGPIAFHALEIIDHGNAKARQ